VVQEAREGGNVPARERTCGRRHQHHCDRLRHSLHVNTRRTTEAIVNVRSIRRLRRTAVGPRGRRIRRRQRQQRLRVERTKCRVAQIQTRLDQQDEHGGTVQYAQARHVHAFISIAQGAPSFLITGPARVNGTRNSPEWSPLDSVAHVRADTGHQGVLRCRGDRRALRSGAVAMTSWLPRESPSRGHRPARKQAPASNGNSLIR